MRDLYFTATPHIWELKIWEQNLLIFSFDHVGPLIREDDIRDLLLRNGEKAIRILFELHYTKLVNISNKITFSKDASKDIVQDVFVRVWEKRQQLGSIRNRPIEDYLIRSTINKSISYIRDNSNRYRILKEQFLASTKGSETSADALVLAAEFHDTIKKRIQSLPPQAKACFLLSRKFYMTYREIASFLGISEKTVESHISSALSHLRKFHREDGTP